MLPVALILIPKQKQLPFFLKKKKQPEKTKHKSPVFYKACAKVTVHQSIKNKARTQVID